MTRRYHEIKGLAEFTAKTIVSSEEDWKKFLHTAGHMYTAITNQYGDALEFNVTDHMMIEAAFIKQEPFKDYCERILAYYNEQ